MGRPVPPVELRFATNLANLICAYFWRARETGAHRPDGACRSCRRLVRSDLHECFGQLLAAAVLVGTDHTAESLSLPSLPELTQYIEEVAERCAEICAERLERVVQSDPRTFEAGLRRT